METIERRRCGWQIGRAGPGHGRRRVRRDRGGAAHPGPAARGTGSRSPPPGRRASWPGCSGPLASLLILIGNAITPGKGYREGPFVSQAELRELLDQAGADSVIEDDERQMLHSVFELGDTLVREVMVPRTEMVWIETHEDAAAGAVAGPALRVSAGSR